VPGRGRPRQPRSSPRIRSRYPPAMVRRDADEGRAVGPGSVCRASATGESPVPVSIGAPGSRSQVPGEIPEARAGRQKPPRREQERGPQHEVKTAASTEKQSGSRAAHVTAKATPCERAPKLSSGPGGVEVAARAQGEARNARGPSAPPSSGRGGSYEPKAKSNAVQRKSEGLTVASIAATKNAAGAKGLRALRVKRKGRHLHAGEAERWTRDSFHALGLHQLRGTVAYPEAA
jgi:hypothetical protein